MNPNQYEVLNRLEDSYWWFCIRARVVERYLKSDGPSRPKLVVDLGCGTGGFLDHLKRTGAFAADQLLGLEPSPIAHEFLKKKGLPFLPYDTERPLRDQLNAAPDVIVMLDVLEHVSDPVALLRDLYALAAPGATLIILVPAFNCLWSKWDDLVGHERRYTLKMLRGELEDSGWGVQFSRYLFSSMFFPGLIRNRFVNDPQGEYVEFPKVPGWLNRLLIFWYDLESRLTWIPVGTTAMVAARKTI